MQGGNSICYHFEIFHGGFLNFTTYYKKIYSLDQAIKKLNNYIMAARKPLSIIINSLYSICKPRIRFNKQEITSGWGFCSNFFY
jgi:hypothetical protein